jgi:hypothetical protein
MEEAARVAFNTIREQAPELEAVRRVRFTLRGTDAAATHEGILKEMGGA